MNTGPASAVAVAVLLVSGCAFEDRRPIPTSPPDAGGFDALLAGYWLAADPRFDGGCLWLESNGHRVSVIWPYGYSVRFGATVDLLDEKGSVVVPRWRRTLDRWGGPAGHRAGTLSSQCGNGPRR